MKATLKIDTATCPYCKSETETFLKFAAESEPYVEEQSTGKCKCEVCRQEFKVLVDFSVTVEEI